MAASKTLTREQRVARAKLASNAAHQPSVAAQKIVREWPALTETQKSQIRTLLAPVCADGGGNGS